MPKSKGTGSSTPKLIQMDKVKDSTLDSLANMGEIAGVFTRSQARRLSITVPDRVSPPKKNRRSSISLQGAETSINPNKLRNQDTKDTSASLSIGKINEEIISKSNVGEISQSTISPKKRKTKKENESESAEKLGELEVQKSVSRKKAKNSGKPSEDSVQDSVITEVKSTKKEKSRKSVIMTKIQEDETMEDLEQMTGNVKPSNNNGTGNQGHQIENSAKCLSEENVLESMDKSRRKLAKKSTPSKPDRPLVEHETTPQSFFKKTVTPTKLSSKKTGIPTDNEKMSKTTFVEKLDNPLLVSKRLMSAEKASNKNFAMSYESTPKNLESPAIENFGKTPPSVLKKPFKGSAKKLEVHTNIEVTPEAIRLPSKVNLDKTPLPVSKKSVSPTKLSAKKADVETAIEKTPKAALSDKLDKTPLSVSKKSVSSAKLSGKRTDFETTIEKTPKAVRSLSIDNTPLLVSKKAKHSAKKSGMEDKSFPPNNMELPTLDKITKAPQPISNKTESPLKLSAKKSNSKEETTPKKIETLTEEMLAKTPAPVLKKPSSPVKLSAKKAVVEDDTDSDEDSDAESRKEIMRSAEKRIIRNLSTSESESRNHVKVLQLPVVDVQAEQQMETSSDSDSAPEDVTFDASRQSALELLKKTVDSIKRDKQKKKEKRKERLEIWRQRKEENLIRLKESKANRDDASCSSSEESLHERNGQLKVGGPQQGKKTYIEDEPTKPNLKRLPADIVNSLPNHLSKIPKMDSSISKNPAGKKRKAGINGKIAGNPSVPNFKKDVEFVPLSGGGKTTFGVVSLGEPTLKTVSHIAANFKQDLLYGNRICRVPASTLANNRKKLQVNMK